MQNLLLELIFWGIMACVTFIFYTEMVRTINTTGNISAKLRFFEWVSVKFTALEHAKYSFPKENGHNLPEKTVFVTGEYYWVIAHNLKETKQLISQLGSKEYYGQCRTGSLFKGKKDCGCDFGTWSSCDGFSKDGTHSPQRELSQESNQSWWANSQNH